MDISGQYIFLICRLLNKKTFLILHNPHSKKIEGGKKYRNNGIKTFMLLSLQNKFKTHVFFKVIFSINWTVFKSLLNFCQTRKKYAKYRALMNVQVMSFQKVRGHLRGENNL